MDSEGRREGGGREEGCSGRIKLGGERELEGRKLGGVRKGGGR